MTTQTLLERWTSVHAFNYFEKFEDREISEQRIFEYLDYAKSNFLPVLLKTHTLTYIIKQFTDTLNDFK